jgi:hypothetical protein
MVHIRSALVTALLVFGAATAASAQRAGQAKGARHARNPDAQLLRGIALSDAERANIKNVHSKYAAQSKTLRDQFKPQLATARDARQRGDTAALRAMRQNAMAQRQQVMGLRQSERTDLRNALSAANQAKFDANAQALKKRLAKQGQLGRGRKPPRGAPGR